MSMGNGSVADIQPPSSELSFHNMDPMSTQQQQQQQQQMPPQGQDQLAWFDTDL